MRKPRWQGFPGGASGRKKTKNLPVSVGGKTDTGCSLGWEDPLEKGMANHSSILDWRIPWTEEPGSLWSIGSHRDEYN